ncbi:MAG: sigma-E processing peptidase SpoIIGA [Ruminococcus sp.]|nr:sigma-E processing peptidase SpoIIGA [Ruminococcus sp.]
MKIYLDILVITNICITLIFTLCLSKLTHIRIKRKDMILSSLIGGISSLLALLRPESSIEGLFLWILKLISIALIVMISLRPDDIEREIKYIFLYILANIIFGGICVLLWSTGSAKVIFVNTLTIYLDISLIKLIVATIVTYIILTLYEFLQRKSFDPNKKYRLLLRIDKLEYMLPAVADTGNSLTDAFTGKPVVIICCDELYYHFQLDREEIALRTGFHCIPYSTINGSGLINVTDKAYVEIIDNDKNKKDIDCAIGITVSNSKASRAVFSPSLII